MLSTAEVAEWMGMPRRQIQEMWRTWEMPGIKIGKYIMFRERDLEAWVDKRATRYQPPGA